MGNLIIACEHIINKKRKGLWSSDKEVILCKFCWDKINKLEKKYKNHIPISKLDFVASYCKNCINKVLKNN